MRLRVDDDELASCVACGLCLPHCPTFRVTGEETRSPRGRIAAMRAVHEGTVEVDAAFIDVIDECVLCRGCEPACPSGVPFGRLMEGTRESLAGGSHYQPWWRRLGYRLLGRHRVLLAVSSALALAQRAGLVPARLGLPRLPLRRAPLVPSGTDVWLFTGCVMDAWMRTTHRNAQRVVEATGSGVRFPVVGGDCCGALALHAGLVDDARRLAQRTIASMPGDAPVLVDAAGCGAVMKDYADLLGTPEAARFAARVLDVHEWLSARVEDLPLPRSDRRPIVAVQDPCHLRHVQRAEQSVRSVLGRYAELVELDDEGMCCGAGGAYAAVHPELAGAIRDRKLAAIERSGATTVASANPGCVIHLRAGGANVVHPLDIVAAAIAPDAGAVGGR